MTKFRFPGRTTKNAANRTRVLGIKKGTDEAAISAEKIYFAHCAWQQLFGASDEEDTVGFTEQEVQQAASHAAEFAYSDEDPENRDFNDILRKIEHDKKQQEKLSAVKQKKTETATKSKLPANSHKASSSKFNTSSRKKLAATGEVPEYETEFSTQKYIKCEPEVKFSSSKAEKRNLKSDILDTHDSKKLKSSTEWSPTTSSILKPSTLKFESFSSGHTLGAKWTQQSTPTLQPTSLPVAKNCIICERMTSYVDVQCDWCREFMQSMAAKTTQKLICLRGRGMCKIAQGERMTRCQACWLACCLTKLPVAHKTLARLRRCLPTSLQYQIGSGIPVKKDPLRGWSDNVSNQAQIAARAIMKKAAKTVNNRNKAVAELVESSKKKHKIKDKPKRQKTHLKGPRIKHVCRRACVVLGQPLATFPTSPDSKDGAVKKLKVPESRSKGDKKLGKLSEESCGPVMLPPEAMGLPALPPSKTDPPAGWICLDYEPPEGACVPIISSDNSTALPPALCLLCGSAGKEELLFCAMCCEPYHIFCLDVTPQLNKMWICERCELCCECKGPTLHHPEVLRCHKCAGPYHKQCLTVKPTQRPWECPSCNVCRSCGAASNTMRQVGNTAFCPPCYKLRLKGNFCPLCQQCYKDDDFDTKMVECAECLSWVHARCEGISDEKYQILSFLPDSVEFHCQNCSAESPAIWQLAVENEIKCGIASIVKNLAKYRAMKVTPHKVEPEAGEPSRMEAPAAVTPSAKSFQEPLKAATAPEVSKQPPVSTQTAEKSQATKLPRATRSSYLGEPSVPSITTRSQSNQTELVAAKSSEQSQNLEVKVPEFIKPNENSKSDSIVQSANTSKTLDAAIGQCTEPPQQKKDPKIEAAKMKLDFSDNKMNLPRLVVRLTDFAKQKPKATQTLKLKQICEAYNIKECSVHLRKCSSEVNPSKSLADPAPPEAPATEAPSACGETSAPATTSQPETKPSLSSPTIKSPDKNANYNVMSQAQSDESKDAVVPLAASEEDNLPKEQAVPKPPSDVARKASDCAVVKQETSVDKQMMLPPKAEAEKRLKLESKCAESPKSKISDTQQLDMKLLTIILRKASLGQFESLVAFDQEFQNDVLKTKSDDIRGHYTQLLSETFPWYKSGKSSSLELEVVVPKVEPCTSSGDRIYGTTKSEFEKSFSQFYLPAYADNRVCALCKTCADEDPFAAERMLHTGMAAPLDWVHANCALWSSEVWEERDGFLHSVVPSAVSRANRTRCSLCDNKGATVGCCHSNSCHNSYHWPCALSLLTPLEGQPRVVLDPLAMKLYCPDHADQHALQHHHVQGEGEDEDEEEEDGSVPDHNFTLPRKLRIELSRNKKRYADPGRVQLAIGSLRVERLGVLSSPLCHEETPDVLVPDGYMARRLFWSTKEPWRIVEYYMQIELEPETSMDEVLARDINLTVEHGSLGAPQEVMEKNLRMLRHIQQQEIDLAKDAEALGMSSKESADDLLLPPDLKETIFQDLTSELLDGISMQDIFTKLLSEDAIKEEALSDSDEPQLLSIVPGNPVREVVEMLIDQVCLVESSDETFRFRKRIVGSPVPECFDDTLSTHRMKLPRTNSSSSFVKYTCIPQLDGADDSSSDSESASKSVDEMKVEVETSLTRKIKERSLAASEPCNEGPVRCLTCRRTYRTKTSYDRHLLGSCTEISSDSSDESTESPTTSRMTTKTSKYGTVVLTTKVVLMQSPDKNNQKRKSSKLVRKTVKLAAKPPPSSTPLTSQSESAGAPVQPLQHIATVEAPNSQFGQNIVYQEPQQPVILGQNPIFVAQPANAVYYIQVTPNKQNYYLVQSPDGPGIMYVQAPEPANDALSQGQIILQPNSGFHNMLTLNPQFTAGQVTQAFCQPSINTAFIPGLNQNLTFSQPHAAYSQGLAQGFAPSEPAVQPMVSGPGGIYLSTGAAAVAPPAFAVVNPTITPSLPAPVLTPDPQQSMQLMSAEKLQEQSFMVQSTSPSPRLVEHQTHLPPRQEGLLKSVPTSLHEMVKPPPKMPAIVHHSTFNSSFSQAFTKPSEPPPPLPAAVVSPMRSFNTVTSSVRLPTSSSSYTVTSSMSHVPSVQREPGHVCLASPQLSYQQQQYQQQQQQQYQQQQLHQFQQHHYQQHHHLMPPVQHVVRPTQPVNQLLSSSRQQHITLPLAPYSTPRLQTPSLPIATPVTKPQQMHYPAPGPRLAKSQETVRPIVTMQRPPIPVLPQPLLRPNTSSLIHIGSYKRPISTNITGNVTKLSHHPQHPHPHIRASTTLTRPRAPAIATATRFYVQPAAVASACEAQSPKAASQPEVPAPSKVPEANVMKITASASVGTQTIPRCVTPSSVKKEPLDSEEKTGKLFKIRSSDGFTTYAGTMDQAWRNVIEAYQKTRKAYNLTPMVFNEYSMSGEHMTGISQDPVKYLIEQLPGLDKCSNYTPKFHNSSQKERARLALREPQLNPSGCARTEPYKGKRKPHDMFSWLASVHRKPFTFLRKKSAGPSRRNMNSLPLAMQFRSLKNTLREKVGVFSSPIHGRGLFCLRDLEHSEMVIEYAGEVIRSNLCDHREKQYEARGIGCYMFKIDEHTVVDATTKGNAARFINHSCEPNCYSRVVDILGKKHILIFALRHIEQGEELTYDYKFPFEEVKIPCTCGSRKCRKYLN